MIHILKYLIIYYEHHINYAYKYFIIYIYFEKYVTIDVFDNSLMIIYVN